ncbi:MAG: antibiotic biosynthesis monooxygenase [Actinobacteria bacterium]|jgi:quinol monooxygenase YgiN|nr:antibiotic biosynthesis monooxygenase [Actinomycetota bacterium]
MIIIHGWADIEPARRDEVAEAAVALEAKSLTEPGNIHYGLSWSVERPNRLCLIEVWTDAAAHHAHTEEANVRAFSQLAAASCVEPPTFERYEGQPTS